MRHFLQDREIDKIIIHSTKYLAFDLLFDECIDKLKSAAEVMQGSCASMARVKKRHSASELSKWHINSSQN